MTAWVQLWVGLLGAIPSNSLKRMAGTTGLEPAASAVTGQRSNQLNYVPTRKSTRCAIASVYAALHDLHILPNLLRASPMCQSASNRGNP
jgi:hypothetical protein